MAIPPIGTIAARPTAPSRAIPTPPTRHIPTSPTPRTGPISTYTIRATPTPAPRPTLT